MLNWAFFIDNVIIPSSAVCQEKITRKMAGSLIAHRVWRKDASRF
jgi:hypothetical protein